MRVKAYATVRSLLGTGSLDLQPPGRPTVRQVLRELVRQYPQLAEQLWDEEEVLTGSVLVLVNGRAVEFLGGLDAHISPEAEISLFPPVAGGAEE